MNSSFDDIINLPHFHDPTRGYMSNQERAAQFMPFKSLNEYESYVAEKTDEADNAKDADYEIIYE